MTFIRLKAAGRKRAELIAAAAAAAFATEAAVGNPAAYDGVFTDAFAQCRAEFEAADRALLSDTFLVYDADDAQVGEVWLVKRDAPVANCRHILWLTVRPDHRRRGLASATIDHLVVEAMKLGVAALTLNVFAANEAAAALYRRCGFERYDRGLIRWLAADRPRAR